MADLSMERLEELVGPRVRFYPRIDSTNRVGAEWAREGAPSGSLVVADHQTAGRGRLGRSWFSLPGSSLLFSLIVRPPASFAGLALINLAAAVAVAGGISTMLPEVGLEPAVRWPNDVLLSGRKVSGILSEVEAEVEVEAGPGRASWVVLGVGINVNISRGDFPEELRWTATSLAAEAGASFDRAVLLDLVLDQFSSRLAEGLGDPRAILEAYRPLCETLGRRVRVETAGRTLEGMAVDLDPAGGLVLQGGEVVRSGDVFHLS
ncbi:MAG: biotin--[acetyl-CoA-carboxylase] ligase [Actinomycetota bacterium]